ncbi:MAG TPA: VanZ family protein [Gemmatimonadaceae bacterium]|nr:VanZ family protein [Gemmatimonadaceae bacterium]
MRGSRWIPPLLWLGVILVLTSIPNPRVGAVSVPGADKLVHGALYAVLGWLTLRAAWQPGAGWRLAALLFLVVALVGAADEWHQRFIPGRSADPHDWLADATGAATGIGLACAAARRRGAERPS